jgi:hypothetical protein
MLPVKFLDGNAPYADQKVSPTIMKTINLSGRQRKTLLSLFFVPSYAFLTLSFHAPILLTLGGNSESTMSLRGLVKVTIPRNIRIEGLIVNSVLLQIFKVLV